MLDPAAVLERLHRLDRVLGAGNPALGNLELARHIERIDCLPDGRVEMRTNVVGVFEGAAELLTPPGAEAPAGTPADGRVVPRRRAKRRLDAAGDDAPPADCGPALLDPARFAGLDARWVWTETATLSAEPCWSEKNAADLAARRRQGLTHEALAETFGVTVPTIRHALRIAAGRGLTDGLPKKQPRPRWPEDHAEEVAAARAESPTPTLKQLSERFGRSEPLIREALKIAAARAAARQPPAPEQS